MKHLTILLSAWFLCTLSLHADNSKDQLEQIEWLTFEEEFEKAQRLLEELGAREPKLMDKISYWQGIIALKKDQPILAKLIFQEQIKRKEKSPFTWAGMGHLYAYRKDLGYSQMCIEKAMKYGSLKNTDLELAITRANLEGQTGKNATSRAILLNISEKYPQDISPKLVLFDYYKKRGIVESAADLGKKMIPLAPNKAKIYVDLAELYLDKWNRALPHMNRDDALKTAYRYIQEAFADKPGYPDAFRIRAELYIRCNFPGKFQKARDDMAVYLKLNHHDEQARVRYAKFLFLTEAYPETLTLISDLQQKGNPDKALHRLKAISLYETGKFSAAKAAMDVYFNLVKPEYRISKDYETYGDILRILHTPDQAQKYYDLAIGLKEERVSLYGEIAEEYFNKAKAKAAEMTQIKQSSKTVDQRLNEMKHMYDSLVLAQHLDTMNAHKLAEKREDIDLLSDQLEILYKDTQHLDRQLLDIYTREAYYWEKALTFEDELSLRNRRKYADALFNARQYEEAEQAYIYIHKLNEGYFYPYEKRLQIALRLAKKDGEKGPGLKRAVPVSEEILRIFLPQVDTLKNQQKKSILIALESMAFYSFNPNGTDEYNCDIAQSYIDQLKEIDQTYFDRKEGLKLMDGFCME